ncbi:MAG: TIGR01841 family phasin [Rhodocyclaceae bacterium]|nr:TIGR01841 family phasin [Rhodocyclaceae bacterium]
MTKANADQAAPAGLMGDFGKLVEQFKLPGVDLGAVLEARREDLQALAAANRSALEDMQALGRKQAEMLQSAMQELQTLAQQLSSSGAAAPTLAVQQVLQRTFASMRELAEVASKSQTDAFARMAERVQQNLQEVKTLLQPKP